MRGDDPADTDGPELQIHLDLDLGDPGPERPCLAGLSLAVRLDRRIQGLLAAPHRLVAEGLAQADQLGEVVRVPARAGVPARATSAQDELPVLNATMKSAV